MNELPGFLGWATAILYGAAVINFFLKRINKQYINKLPKENQKTITYYRKIMRFFVKNHKWFGLGAGVVVISHFILMSLTSFVSGSGLIAMTALLVTVLIGVYGLFVNKNLRGVWVKYHRIIGLVIILLIIIHLV